jgi:hypothetical protein
MGFKSATDNNITMLVVNSCEFLAEKLRKIKDDKRR